MRRLFVILAALAVMCSVPLASARVLDVLPDVTSEATSSSGAIVTYNDTGLTCSPPSGSQFQLGDTTVDCGADGSFVVHVVDTTAPIISNVPSDFTIEAGAPPPTYSPTATDTVDGSVNVSCSPPSGSTFPLGDTTVTCTATDAHANSSQATFAVHVVDTTNPTISLSGPSGAIEATGPSTPVTYTVNASDNAGPPSVDCGSHASGSGFPVGDTTVTCTATDGSGHSASDSLTITVKDQTAPTVSVPGNLTFSVGDTVTFSVSANDLVDGPLTPSCDHASGSSFPIGTTSVSCSATDAHGNEGHASFNVVVADNAGPTLSNVPGTITREANGPSGSVVTYATPTAVDNVDGPRLVSCSPASGSTFPLGTTTVTCSASDTHGNNGNAQFSVRVVDTTPPNLIAPEDWNAYATTDAGLPINEAAASSFLSAASVSDLVDPHPTVTTDAPALFPVGKTTVIFTVRDASGNVRSAPGTLTVRPKPAEGTTPEPLPPPADRIPPDDVKNLAAAAGDGSVTLTWGRPTAPDFSTVKVTRSLGTGGGDTVVYTGSATRFVDRGVENGVEYRYLVVALDKNGNPSAGVAVSAKPARTVLRAPKDGAVVKKPPKFVWLAFADATYYNFQLFRGTTKILSAWPKKPTITLKKTWKFDGRKYKLTPGVYKWYVWPGFGPRANVDYGELLGASSFTVRR